MDKKPYVSLPHSACEVLYAIWKLQSRPGFQGRGVTREEIAEMLQKTPNRVSGIIHSITKESDSYLSIVTHPRPETEGKKGHPLHYYHLNQKEFVTTPYTAAVLLALYTFPPEQPMGINRKEFVKHLAQTVERDKEAVQKRITWGINNSYIHSEDGSPHLWPHKRIDCEREYLQLLEGHVPRL